MLFNTYKSRARRLLARLKKARELRDALLFMADLVIKDRDALKLEVEHLRGWLDETKGRLADAERRAQEHFQDYNDRLQTGLYELVLPNNAGGEVQKAGHCYLRPITEDQASRAFDLADCQPSDGILYLTDEGSVVPVTLGDKTRHEPDDRGETPFEYASSVMYAGGKVVGYVTHTDH